MNEKSACKKINSPLCKNLNIYNNDIAFIEMHKNNVCDDFARRSLKSN